MRTFNKEIRFETGGKRFLLVHGSPRRTNEYLFEDRPLSSFQHIAKDAESDIIVCGHTHKPYTKEVDKVLFINDGSAGKPKDGDARACYAVIYVSNGLVDVTFHRITYDVGAVASAICASELPD